MGAGCIAGAVLTYEQGGTVVGTATKNARDGLDDIPVGFALGDARFVAMPASLWSCCAPPGFFPYHAESTGPYTVRSAAAEVDAGP